MVVEVRVVVDVAVVVSSAAVVKDVEGGANVWTTSGGTYPEGPGWGSAASIVFVSVSVSIPVSWDCTGWRLRRSQHIFVKFYIEIIRPS